jgi:hypothetical protein
MTGREIFRNLKQIPSLRASKGVDRAFARPDAQSRLSFQFASQDVRVAGVQEMSTTQLEYAPMSDGSQVEEPDWAMTRARSGAAWLDSQFGPAWDRDIDFEKLEIGSPIRCIVGQLILHGYLSLLFATHIVDHGFSRGLLDILVVLLPIGPFKRAYRPLTNAWKVVLNERRGSSEPHVPAEAAKSHRENYGQAA